MGAIEVRGKAFVAGKARGIALVSDEPLSFWGGYDWETGEIIDRRHPLSGEIAKNRILAIPFTRGSSTTSSVLLESIRAMTAPAAIITTATDVFFALAAVVADKLYATNLPLIAISESDFAGLETGDRIELDGDVIRLEKRQS